MGSWGSYPDAVLNVIPEHGQVPRKSIRLKLQLLEQPPLQTNTQHKEVVRVSCMT
jgi:hypothetical protein